MEPDRAAKRDDCCNAADAAKHDDEANWHLAHVNARSFEQDRRGPGFAALSLVKVAPTYYRASVYREKEPPEISHIRNYRLWIHSFRLCRRADRVSQFQ